MLRRRDPQGYWPAKSASNLSKHGIDFDQAQALWDDPWMLGAIGQFETEIRAERQMDGIKKAKDRGVRFGKRPTLSEDQIAELRDKRAKGTLIRDLMAEYSLSKATIYRYLGTNET